jgi:hypothetical protein
MIFEFHRKRTVVISELPITFQVLTRVVLPNTMQLLGKMLLGILFLPNTKPPMQAPGAVEGG